MSPPVRNEMRRGARLLKSFAGETTLAAMFVVSVAIAERDHRDAARRPGRRSAPSSSTGSQITWPPGKMIAVAEVTATPMNA